MRDELAGFSALARIQEYQERIARIKKDFQSAAIRAADIPASPLAPMTSLEMMSITLQEIFLTKGGVHITVTANAKDEGALVLRLAPTPVEFLCDNVPRTAAPETIQKVITATLSKMATMDYASEVSIQPKKSKIKADNKESLFHFIEGIINHTSNLFAASQIQLEEMDTTEYKEVMEDLSTRALVLCADRHTSDELFRSITTKPYISMEHYLSHLFLASGANLSISLDHIQRRLQQEDHLSPGLRDNAFIFGGNH